MLSWLAGWLAGCVNSRMPHLCSRHELRVCWNLRQHLRKNDAVREDVSLLAVLLPVETLRCHPVRRPHHLCVVASSGVGSMVSLMGSSQVKSICATPKVCFHNKWLQNCVQAFHFLNPLSLIWAGQKLESYPL